MVLQSVTATCDSTVGIKAAELEGRVLNGLKDILVGNDDLIEAFATEFKAEVTRLCKQRGVRERQVQKDLNKVNAAIQRCLTFITEGDGDPGLVRDELRSLETRKREAEQLLDAVRDDRAVELHPNMAELYAKKATELQSLLTDEAARPQATDIIRSMIDRIEVHAGTEYGRPDVVLVGALAQILAFTQQKTTAAPGSGGGGRVLMVAGVGFEPTTFRL